PSFCTPEQFRPLFSEQDLTPFFRSTRLRQRYRSRLLCSPFQFRQGGQQNDHPVQQLAERDESAVGRRQGDAPPGLEGDDRVAQPLTPAARGSAGLQKGTQLFSWRARK